jgi:hypothetical protein
MIIKKNLVWINNKIILILINLLVLLFFWLILEMVTGDFFYKKKKFTCTKTIFKYIPCNMNSKFILNGLYDNKKKEILYKRDQYGLRGRSKSLKKIDILTVGGSTTDEKFVDEKKTWSEQLEYLINNSSKSNKIDVVNAGIDGQSTFGHIWNFENWFNLIDNFSPNYIIFYIGLNEKEIDQKYNSNINFQEKNYKDNELSFIKKIKLFIKMNNGFTYSLYRHINNFYLTNFSELDKSVIRHGSKNSNDHYIKIEHKKFVVNEQFSENLNSRLKKLKFLTEKLNATPIFVTQITHRWVELNEDIYIINQFSEDYYYKEKYIANLIKKFSVENNVFFIDLFNIMKFNQEDTYDYFHTTPIGSYKVAKIIFDNIEILK